MTAGGPPPIAAGDVVVLDVDDTLYLERSYVRSGFAAVGRLVEETCGVPGVGATLWTGFEAGVRGDAFDRALVAHDIDVEPGLIATLVECYRSHRPDIELLPDARRLIERLGSRRAAVITDGPAASQRAKVEALGLADGSPAGAGPAVGPRIDPIVITSELGPGHGKPDPLPYTTVEQMVGAAPDACWYIGDNPTKDFVTPLARRWTAVRIRRELSLHAGLDTPPGVTEITSLDELMCASS